MKEIDNELEKIEVVLDEEGRPVRLRADILSIKHKLCDWIPNIHGSVFQKILEIKQTTQLVRKSVAYQQLPLVIETVHNNNIIKNINRRSNCPYFFQQILTNIPILHQSKSQTHPLSKEYGSDQVI